MTIKQTLESAGLLTIWKHTIGSTTYFLEKTNNPRTGKPVYRVWTSGDSTRYDVTLDQAVQYYSQHNLGGSATTTPSPAPVKTVSNPTPIPTKTTTTPVKTVPKPAIVTAADPASFDPNARGNFSETKVTKSPAPVTAADPASFDPNARKNFPESELASSPEVAQTPNQEIITIAANQDSTQFSARSDWRVRLALTDDTSANYLYKASDPKILKPLAETNGVIFPYTPQISVTYAANYDLASIVHTNYKVYQYSNSAVDAIQITCDFTAQDTYEANYLLAVIHFFRSMTKMFYGQDQNPKHGTPPPLCYLFGLGTFQFSAHPLAITGFTYNLPNDVDYIKTVSMYTPGTEQSAKSVLSGVSSALSRLAGTDVNVGGKAKDPNFTGLSSNQTGEVTWVPTKIQLSISCIPMQSRNQVSNKFSLEKYASGDLLNGIKNPGGAFW